VRAGVLAGLVGLCCVVSCCLLLCCVLVGWGDLGGCDLKKM
jgi:hypothetical protein